MGFMCDWFAPVNRVIGERTGDGICCHPHISQCVSRARTWCWWMAYNQVACGYEEQSSAVLGAVPGVLGYSLRERPYTYPSTFPISTLKHHYLGLPGFAGTRLDQLS